MKKGIFSLVLALFSLYAFATHNRAGEITYKCLGNNDYIFTITTYTKCSSPADRCELTLIIAQHGNPCGNIIDSLIIDRKNGPNGLAGDGCGHFCVFSQGMGVNVINANDVKQNVYYNTIPYHFSGPGDYMLYVYDPNRNSGVINIPNSVNTPFWIESRLIISPFFSGPCNSSPQLTVPPIDKACVGKIFIHNPGAWDPDGDSLSYKLTCCKGVCGQCVPGFDQYPSGSSVVITQYGDFIWTVPPAVGEYNFAFEIHEWRKIGSKYYEIGYVERDMQIDVETCSNTPPVIADLNDTCVIANTNLSFPVTATDIPTNSTVTLTAYGGPFQTSPSASFPQGIQGTGTVTGTFSWTPNCDRVRNQPYLVTFKATDDGKPDNPLVPLTDFKSVNIYVIAPAPQNLTCSALCNSITLNWTAEVCNPTSNALQGYKVFRKPACGTWTPSYCETGVPAYTGYAQVGTTASTTFTDNGLTPGVQYSYRVCAYFADGAQSKASAEACCSLKRDLPILTNVDVLTTSTTTGQIQVKWVNPIGGDGSCSNCLDTTTYKPPYQYKLLRKNGFVNPTGLVTTFNAATFAQLLTFTSYTDNNLNTQDSAYTYKLELYYTDNNNTLQKVCSDYASASSVFVKCSSTDNQITLTWQANVPWNNYQYNIWKEIPTLSGNWFKIDSTTSLTYTDTGLVNGATYCYYIQSVGQYSDTTLPRPLLNNSQRLCCVPVDNIPPCPPVLTVTCDCSIGANSLSWTNPNLSCADDVVKYNIYYTPVQGGDWQLLYVVNGATNTSYIHDSLFSVAGCYAVTAVDSFNNESILSNIACCDNCPEYSLPNVFSPNGDGQNDFFIPFPYRYVKDIDIRIYDRWGLLVFETFDPNINWDGRNKDSGKPCSDGVYYYVCDVHEIRLEGIQTIVLKGFIHLLRGKQ